MLKWEYKAKIMKLCANLQSGDRIYKFFQKNFGRLDSNPMSRIPTQIEMARWILDEGMEIKRKVFFEVGTGHKPVVPIGFFLSGAASVITVDLNTRLDYALTRSVLQKIVENRETIESLYGDIVDSDTLGQRLSVVEKLYDTPKVFLKEANIQYLAPADAANTNLPDKSIDYHFSVTTLEHIPADVLRAIFVEADRILGVEGVAIHFIDPSDHFQHQDKSISAINFLQFSDKEWLDLAGNEFAYCNRLRASDYFNIFQELSFEMVGSQSTINNGALTALKNGFPLSNAFDAHTLNDLCTTELRVMLRKRLNG